jgi:hypothetical protein
MKRRVALAALELPDLQRALDAVTAQIANERRFVETMLGQNVDEFGYTGHLGSVSYPLTQPMRIARAMCTNP